MKKLTTNFEVKKVLKKKMEPRGKGRKILEILSTKVQQEKKAKMAELKPVLVDGSHC